MFLGDGLFLGLPHHHETWQNAADIYIYCQCPWDRKLAIVICEACGTAIVKLRPPELNDFVVASSQPAGQEALWRAKGEAWEVR
jgi:hypothetical protein